MGDDLTMARSETTDRHANARDRKRANSRKMVVTGRSILTIADVRNRRAAEGPHSFMGSAKACKRCQAPRRAPIHDGVA